MKANFLFSSTRYPIACFFNLLYTTGMPSPEIITYLQSQLAAGQTRENLATLLTQNGWQESDIQAAFAAIVAPTPARKPAGRRTLVVISLLILLILGAGGIGVWYYLNHKKSTPKPTTSPTANVTSLVKYVNSVGSYSFNYLQTWKAISPGADAVGVVSPETKANPKYANLGGISDVGVSATAFSNASDSQKTPDQQAQDLLAHTGNQITALTQGSFKGYSASNGSGLDVILLGKKNLYIFNFLDAKSLANLSVGQRIVLNTFVEL